MTFNKHFNIKQDMHALLGASKYYWLNYNSDALKNYYYTQMAAIQGTKLHAFAKQCIELKQKLPRSNKTLNAYVNDAIGFRLIPEQVLFYSENCFGTADAIGFHNKILRIHDLKTGKTPAKFEQLLIYAGLFFLEYNIKPSDVFTELRIYQNDEVGILIPEVDELIWVKDRIVESDKVIKELKFQEE